ncbi:MAG: tail fiber protein [Burkholderiales bacterium]|nr:tail fiber protein [Burkholderiales bacterium]
MHRIDAAGHTGNQFTDGDPGSGVPATVVDAAWLNAVQDELVNVVEGAGLVLSKPAHTQLLAAIKALCAVYSPPGKVAAFARTGAISGWLACDGQLVSRSTYAALFAAIGTTFGAGDGSTTFGLPDLRGEFIRGLDAGRGVDAGRSLGSTQEDMIEAHQHVGAVGEAGQTPFGATSTLFVGVGSADSNNPRPYTNDGSDYDGGAVNAAGVIGAETRPRNVALRYYIKT